MAKNIIIKYVAEMFCTVEADSVEEIVRAVQEGNYDLLDETAADNGEIFIIEDDAVRKIADCAW